MRKRSIILGVAALVLLGTSSARAAEDSGMRAEPPPASRRAPTRPRIEVHPGRLHRECVDGYREVWRPYWGGYVVTPFMRCWWSRG